MGEHLPCKQGVKSSNLSVSTEFERIQPSTLKTEYRQIFNRKDIELLRIGIYEEVKLIEKINLRKFQERKFKKERIRKDTNENHFLVLIDSNAMLSKE